MVSAETAQTTGIFQNGNNQYLKNEVKSMKQLRYDQCYITCENCKKEQIHTFDFKNYIMPQYHHDQEYDFNFVCKKCKKRSTAVFHREYYEIGFLENIGY